jgi:hypothetical protein
MRDFISKLKKTRQAIILDNRAFEDFNMGVISIEELYEGMKKNNNMKNVKKPDMKDFEDWVHKLGW